MTEGRQRQVDAVAIGCSAGGVDALSQLLPALSTSARVPVFVVVHLPRERPSHLIDIFGSKCRMKVAEAEDKQPALPGTVYFAPPDYHLLIDEGPQLALSADEPVHFCRPAVDVLFESAADAFGATLLGIVLSGANNDGAAGLAAIHRAGGVTLVQRPETAAAAAMPGAARLAVPDSLVLELAEIAEVLRAIKDGRCPSACLSPRSPP